MRHSLITASVVAATALALTACSSSGGSGKSSSSPGSGSESAATGTAYTIGIIVDETGPTGAPAQPEAVQAAQAAVDSINASGGAGGHPLKLKVCNSKGDPNQTQTCARQFAADSSILTTVGNVATAASPTAVLGQSGVASFANFAISPSDLSSKYSFPLFDSLTGPACALATLVKFAKPTPTKVGYAYVSVPGVSSSVPQIQPILNALHAKLKNVVPIAPSTSDLSASISAATAGVKAVGILMSPPVDQQFILQARSSGYTGAISATSLGSKEFKALGSSSNNIYMCASFRDATTGFAGGKQFLADTKGVKSFEIGTASENSWLGVYMLRDVLKKLTSPTRASVFAALNNLTAADTYGFTPPYTATKPYTGLGGQFPRLMSRYSYYEQFKNGKVVLLSTTPDEY